MPFGKAQGFKFANTFLIGGSTGKLNDLLDKIKAATSKGEKDAAKAYADAHAEAKKVVEKDIVAPWSDEQIGWAWAGLELSSPPDKRRGDIANSILAAWDKSAAKYMRLKVSEGDAERSKFDARVKEFDTAISSKGKTKVKKDE